MGQTNRSRATADDGKKSLTIAVLNDVVSLDPAVKDSSAEMQMASHLYDPLVDYNADMSKKPGLAESWKVLDDGVTWEFKLRQGVKFSNGNDFNADDVVFSFERILLLWSWACTSCVFRKSRRWMITPCSW